MQQPEARMLSLDFFDFAMRLPDRWSEEGPLSSIRAGFCQSQARRIDRIYKAIFSCSPTLLSNHHLSSSVTSPLSLSKSLTLFALTSSPPKKQILTETLSSTFFLSETSRCRLLSPS